MKTLRCFISGMLMAGMVLQSANMPAQSLEEDLALIFKLYTGRWEGSIEGTNPQSGETFKVEDSYTFATTSEDGMDTVTWSDMGLILREHLGDGVYHSRTWGPNGPGFEEQLQYQVLAAPGTEGGTSWISAGVTTAPDGTVIEGRETFTLSGDTLSLTTELRRQGIDETYQTIATGKWKRFLIPED